MQPTLTKHRVLKVHPADDVIVALTDLAAGNMIELAGETYVLRQAIPAKHKFAAKAFAAGDPVHMYGVLVGKATQPIRIGDPITTQNLHHAADPYQLRAHRTGWQAPDVSKFANQTFMGYLRADGSVGTANYWLVIPLVFCENRNLMVMKEALVKELGYETRQPYKLQAATLVQLYQSGKSADEILATNVLAKAETAPKSRLFPNVDGIKFLTHEGGCGGTRQDSDALCGLLAGYVTHPNVAGITVLSLGCQHAQAAILQESIQKRDSNFAKPLFVFEQQQYGTESALLSDAIKQTFVGLMEANRLERKPAPLSKLVVGLECGGSDGFSGISANPAIGHTSDLVVALGGATVLSEFPELCGVEQELSDRCVDDATAQRFLALMQAYAASAKAVGSGFDMNPSPGNIKDGLITDAIKSAGAAKKGGTSPITAVLDYPEKVTKAGLNLLCTPGNDVESTTALAAAGCNVILFTTGLGTPTGNPVSPIIKLSSNTKLSEKMPDIIDVNTGDIITGEKTIEQKGEEILELIIKVASGEITPKAVQLGQDDFIPWKRGVSL